MMIEVRPVILNENELLAIAQSSETALTPRPDFEEAEYMFLISEMVLNVDH